MPRPLRFTASTLKPLVAGETAPFSHWDSKGKPTAPGPLLFLRKLLCVDSSGHPTCSTNVRADIFATHPYTSGNAFHHAFNANDVSFGDLPQWKALIAAASKAKHITNGNGGHGVGLWMLQIDLGLEADRPRMHARGLHARWTAEALYRTWQLGIGALLWGQLHDLPSARTSSSASTSRVSTTATTRRRSRILVRAIRIRNRPRPSPR